MNKVQLDCFQKALHLDSNKYGKPFTSNNEFYENYTRRCHPYTKGGIRKKKGQAVQLIHDFC